MLPGYPHNVDSPVDSAAFEGRTLTEIDFSTTNLEIGGFRAYDFFGDGSFFLLGLCLVLGAVGKLTVLT
jgi:hypothetical protein